MNKIKLNKIFIGGLNMSGKSQLLQLLNSHPNILIYPFHKFGISYDLENFIRRFRDRKKEIRESRNYFHIYEKKINFNEYIPIESIIDYVLQSGSTGLFLLESNFSKSCTAYAGDEHTESIKFNFDLKVFLDQIKLYQKKFSSKKISFESLENIIFISFIKSVKEYKNFNLKKDFFLQMAANGSQHILNLDKYFKDYKYILIKRDLLNRLYSNVKRMLKSKKIELTKFNLYESIIRNIENYKNYEESFNLRIRRLKISNKNIMEIEFNDLCNDKHITMLEILKFLSLKYSSKVLEPTFIKSKLKIHKNDIINENDKIENHFKLSEVNNIKKISKNIYFLKVYVFIFRLSNRYLHIKFTP